MIANEYNKWFASGTHGNTPKEHAKLSIDDDILCVAAVLGEYFVFGCESGDLYSVNPVTGEYTVFNFNSPITLVEPFPNSPVVLIATEEGSLFKVNSSNMFHEEVECIRRMERGPVTCAKGGFWEKKGVVFVCTARHVHIVNLQAKCILERETLLNHPTSIDIFNEDVEIHYKPDKTTEVLEKSTLFRLGVETFRDDVLHRDITTGAVLYEDGDCVSVRPSQNDDLVYALDCKDRVESARLHLGWKIALVSYQDRISVVDVPSGKELRVVQVGGDFMDYAFTNTHMLVGREGGFSIFKLI